MLQFGTVSKIRTEAIDAKFDRSIVLDNLKRFLLWDADLTRYMAL